AIRSVLTAIKIKEKELKRSPTETEIQQLIANQIKQRRESLEQYSQAGRQDLAGSEKNEITVLQSFLPEALTPEQLDQLIDEVIKEVEAHSPKDMGKVMKVLLPKIAGRAEGKQVNEIVKEKLQS
ncbi:MAG: GatB/YqeY domain-containing protein, partial [Desulfoferrobacter sp.]